MMTLNPDYKAAAGPQAIYYVDAAIGDDRTGDGSSDRPYKTINRVISEWPKDLGGLSRTIRVRPGVYDESLRLTGYYSSDYTGITLIAADPDNVPTITGGVSIYACQVPINFDGFTIMRNGNIDVESLWNSFANFSRVNFAGDRLGLYADGGICNVQSCTASDKSEQAIQITAGMMYANAISGSNNKVCFVSGSDASGFPGLLVCGRCSISGETKYQKLRGGVVFENGVLV